MKLHIIAITLALGRGKKDDSPPAPFTGVLTPDRIMAAKDPVKLGSSWSKALPILEAKLGKPQKVDGKKYKWAATEGDSCTYIVVQESDGKVDAYYNPMTVAKDGAIMNRAECLDILGKTGTPEDPNAPGPPSDGSTVAAADFLKNAVAGRSKWNGKRVKVSGKTPSAIVGGDAVYVSDVRCETKDAQSTPMNKDAIAEGTVKISRSVTGGGEYKDTAELVDCTITTK